MSRNPAPAPLSIGAMLTHAMNALEAGRLAEADALCRRVLQARPGQYDALVLLGIVKTGRGDRPDAIRLLRRATSINPGAPIGHLKLGDALHDAGQRTEALASYDAALALAPDNADIVNNRANVLRDLGRVAEALAGYERAVGLVPGFVDAHNNRGALLEQTGRSAEALASHDRALAIAPAHPLAWFGRGVALIMLERHEEAVSAFTQALAANPKFPKALNNRGNALAALGRHQAAIADYDRAIQLLPHNPEALRNKGNAMRSLGDPEAALVLYRRALAQRPDYAEAFTNQAAALLELGRPAEAMAASDRALAIDPASPNAWTKRGLALQALGRHQEGMECYLRTLAINPDHPEANWNEALCRLLFGDFTEGWQKYEWRWRQPARPMHRRDFGRPLWLGEQDPAGKTILVYAEQGHGDTLQFCRYATLLARRGARVVLEAQPALVSLLASLAGVAEIVAYRDTLPEFDCFCPMLSLPLAFGTTLETIPAEVPYLAPPPERVAHWRERLAGTGPRIGLAWSGNPQHPQDYQRSVALARLAPLLDTAASFVSLQKDIRETDREWLAAHPSLIHFGDDLADFGDTAALVSLCDLVISVDTATAHLAGALGAPVWIMLPGEWRYLLDRDDSPWYPTARLFRHATPGDWDSVIGPVAQELRARFGPA